MKTKQQKQNEAGVRILHNSAIIYARIAFLNSGKQEMTFRATTAKKECKKYLAEAWHVMNDLNLFKETWATLCLNNNLPKDYML